jgi:PP-loop superfamily ATP-utilizing enzyme
MILLWSCMAVAALCMVLAGAQAVRLLTACGQSVTRGELRLAAEQAEHQRAEQQIEAQKILLGQAGAWMRAHRPEPTK